MPARRHVLFPLLLYGSFLALMACHELGHLLHAWLSGGTVVKIHFSLFEFSRTELLHNPAPRFVAWGGFIWGSLLPLLVFLLMAKTGLRLRRLLGFFAGLCLIGNGAYIGLGWINRAGDAGDLLRHGISPLLLSTIGGFAFILGLFLWHMITLRPQRPDPPPQKPSATTA